MPELKFKIGNKDYSLYCEDGEEDDLKKAVEIVNEKMDLFKNENDIPLARKFLMISILIANDLSQNNNRDFFLVEDFLIFESRFSSPFGPLFSDLRLFRIFQLIDGHSNSRN